MGGFRKAGVFPMNLGSIDDKMLSPSEAFKPHKPLHDQNAYPELTQQQNDF